MIGFNITDAIDTWFAEYGAIFNIGVDPYAEAQLKVLRRDEVDDRIVIHAENYGERFPVQPGNREWNHHPLLEAAVEYMDVPDDVAFEVAIYSEAPAGASTGTSAAVTVALIGSLDMLTAFPWTDDHVKDNHSYPSKAAVRASMYACVSVLLFLFCVVLLLKIKVFNLC